MARTRTRDYGWVDYSADDVLDFPRGIPGFPDCRRFLTLRPNPDEPFVVLQSLDRAETAFLTIPVECVAPGYELRMIEDDRRLLGGRNTPKSVLAMLSLAGGGEATVNLLGPVVIDQTLRRGVQAVRDDGRYGAAESLEALMAAVGGPGSCS